MQLFIQRVFDGLQAGAIYAMFALAIVIIFRASGMLNFAQGEIAMFTTFVAWNLFDSSMPWWAASVASLLIGFIVGARSCTGCSSSASAGPMPIRSRSSW